MKFECPYLDCLRISKIVQFLYYVLTFRYLYELRNYSMVPIKRTVFLPTVTVLKNTVRLTGTIE